MNATLTAPHTFTASTEDRARCTCGKSRNTKAHGYTPTRGAGRVAAEKLADAAVRQEQAADTAQAAEDAVEAVYARFAANRTEGTPFTAEENASLEADAAAELAAEQAEVDAAEAAREAAWEASQEVAVTDAAEAARQQVLSHPVFAGLSEEARAQIAANAAEIAAYAAEVAAKPAKAPKAKAPKAPRTPKEAPPVPAGQIGTGVVRFTLTTEEAGTVAYTSGSQINRDYAKAVEEGRPAVLRTIKGHIIRQNPSA